MSSRLLTAEGTTYPVSKVFNQGILDEDALAKYGVPRLSGTFAYGMFMANAAVRAQILFPRTLARTKLNTITDRGCDHTLYPLLGQGYY